jgi:hypothetical protein
MPEPEIEHHQPRPVFIIGAPRSGTSILTWCLAQHSNILIVPETNWIAALTSQLNHLYARGTASGFYTQLSNFETTQSEFDGAFGLMIDKLVRDGFEKRYGEERARLAAGGEPEPVRAWVRTAKDPKRRWVDGTPANTPYAIKLAQVFPEGRFIHFIRNPDDVLASLFSFPNLKTHWDSNIAALSYAHNCVRAALMLERALGPERVIRIRYDELIADSKSAMMRMLTFLDEPYEANCIAPLRETINQSDPEAKNRMDLSSFQDRQELIELRNWYGSATGDAGPLDTAPEEARAHCLAYAAIPLNAPTPD